MNKIFSVICAPLMLINSNVYTFISGIVLSLSTGIITTLCMEKWSFVTSWNLYASSIVYTILGAMLIYVATRVSTYQDYIKDKDIVSYDERKSVLSDHEGYHCVFWVLFFTVMLLSLISGTALLLLKYII